MADGSERPADAGLTAASGAADGNAYRFGDAVIAVEVGDPDGARWLCELLTPWFALVASVAGGPRVRVTPSAGRFAELAATQLQAATRPLPCFTLDSALVSYPAWTETDGTTVVADGEYGCYYRVLGDQVEIVMRPRDRLARMGLLRVVREMAMARALASAGVLDLHAAGFVVRDLAVLLVGGKRTGKTSLLGHVLASEHAPLLANDRVLVDGASLRATGVPSVVAPDEGTLRRLPALGRGLPRRAALLHAGELASAEAVASASGPRLVISPAQFARQLGATTQASARLGVIVFSEIAPDEAMWSLHPLGRDEGAQRLLTGVYAGPARPRAPTLFQGAAAPASQATAQAELARRLAGAVPLVHCRLGPDAYRGHARAWLRALPLPKDGSAA